MLIGVRFAPSSLTHSSNVAGISDQLCFLMRPAFSHAIEHGFPSVARARPPIRAVSPILSRSNLVAKQRRQQRLYLAADVTNRDFIHGASGGLLAHATHRMLRIDRRNIHFCGL